MDEIKFDIRYEDLLNLSTNFNTNLSELIEDLDSMKSKATIFTTNSKFNGQGADAMKAYFNERHIPMIDLIKATAQSLLDTVAIYKDMYFQHEPTTNFRIPQEGLEEYISNMNTKLYDMSNDQDGLCKQIKDALEGVNSYFSDYTYPSAVEFGIENNHEMIATEIQTYIEDTQYIEEEIVNRISSEVCLALEVIVATNAAIGTAWGITEYQPGTLANSDLNNLLNAYTDALNANHEANSEYFEQVWEREAQLAELAAQRETEGYVKIVIGAAVCIVGLACIAVSLGTATPVVVTVGGTIIGGLTAGSSAFIIREGVSDIDLASRGDINSRPVNPVKNILYETTGSDDIYYMLETTLVCLAASITIGVPLGSFGVNIPTLGLHIGRGVMTFSNIGLSTAFGSYVGNQVYEDTGNGYMGVVSGGGTSIVTSMYLPQLEQGVVQLLGGSTYLYDYSDPYSQGVFRQEFERRAMSTAGLSRADARAAYDAFMAGDYNKMASYLDLSTPSNGAVFWSGVSPEVAEEYANSVGGRTLSMTPGGGIFNNWQGFNEMYPSANWDTGLPNDPRPVWAALSTEYAYGAQGQVYHVVPVGYIDNPNSIWNTDEYVVLRELEALKQITGIAEVAR